MPRNKRKIKKGGNSAWEQGAMEYLTTYGWAILIIAIIFAALFYTHFSTVSVRAAPGACQVIRPFGDYSTQIIAQEGICKDALPEFVSSFVSSYASGGVSKGSGNGNGSFSYPSYISIPSLPLLSSSTPGVTPGFTISAWVYWYGPTSAHCQGIFGNNPSPSSGIELYAYGQNNGACGTLWINGSYVKWPNANNSFAPNRWQFVVATYNQANGNATVFVNGSVFTTSTLFPVVPFVSSNSSVIGAVAWPNGDIYPTNGIIADVQVYNTPLSQNDINTLYKEGIGGDPINLYNLAGWWPLNGNANDYSGNNNNGQSYNLTFYSAYTTP